MNKIQLCGMLLSCSNDTYFTAYFTKGNKRREGGGGRRNEGGHRESRVSLNIRSSLLQRCETESSSYHRSFV